MYLLGAGNSTISDDGLVRSGDGLVRSVICRCILWKSVNSIGCILWKSGADVYYGSQGSYDYGSQYY